MKATGHRVDLSVQMAPADVTERADEPVQIIRTNAERRWTGAWILLGLPIGVGALMLTMALGWRALPLAFGPLAGGLTIASMLISMQRTHLELRGDTLRFVGIFRKIVMCERGVPGRVVTVSIDDVRQRDAQIWFGPDRPVMLMTAAWDTDQLADLARRLEFEVIHEPEPLTLPELAKRYPGVVPWAGAHPKLAAWIFIAVTLAVLVPLVA